MIKSTVVITVDLEWSKESADLTPCGCCEEIMVTNTNSWYIFLNNVLSDNEPALKLCNSCFDVFNDIK